MSALEVFLLKDLLEMTHEEITSHDMRRISPRQIYYFKMKYKTPPCCPACGNLLKTGPGFIPCDIIAICPACHWKKDNQKLVTMIELNTGNRQKPDR